MCFATQRPERRFSSKQSFYLRRTPCTVVSVRFCITSSRWTLSACTLSLLRGAIPPVYICPCRLSAFALLVLVRSCNCTSQSAEQGRTGKKIERLEHASILFRHRLRPSNQLARTEAEVTRSRIGELRDAPTLYLYEHP